MEVPRWQMFSYAKARNQRAEREELQGKGWGREMSRKLNGIDGFADVFEHLENFFHT